MDGEALTSWCADLEAAGLPVTHGISGCTGHCLEAPVVQWNERMITEASPARLTATLIEEGSL
jgi:NADH:ubiquinone oxidoreductase subunit E